MPLGRPRRTGDVAQPSGSEVERGLTVRERAHDTRAPPDLAQDALERVVGANAPPVLLREGVVGECFLDRRFHQLGGAAQAQATQLLDHSDGLLARCRDVLAGVDRLEHGRDLPHLGRGHVTEDVAVPVHDAPLPGSLCKELCGAPGKPNTGIRVDEPDALQAAFLKMLEELAPATLVLLRPFANAENLPIAALVHADRTKQRAVPHPAGPAALEQEPIEINIRVLALDRTIAPGLDRPVDLLV